MRVHVFGEVIEANVTHLWDHFFTFQVNIFLLTMFRGQEWDFYKWHWW